MPVQNRDMTLDAALNCNSVTEVDQSTGVNTVVGIFDTTRNIIIQEIEFYVTELLAGAGIVNVGYAADSGAADIDAYVENYDIPNLTAVGVIIEMTQADGIPFILPAGKQLTVGCETVTENGKWRPMVRWTYQDYSTDKPSFV